MYTCWEQATRGGRHHHECQTLRPEPGRRVDKERRLAHMSSSIPAILTETQASRGISKGT